MTDEANTTAQNDPESIGSPRAPEDAAVGALEAPAIRQAWSDFPEGSIAHDPNGGTWTKVPNGWRASGGDVFPTPGAAATIGSVTVPAPPIVPAPPLNARQLRFVEEYPKDLNGTLAAQRAGYKGGEKSCGIQAVRLLADARVQAALSVKLAERSKRVEIEADDVLREFWAIAKADPRELIEYRVGCCRYCWGDRHHYQRTPEEARADRREWERLNEAPDPEKIARWRELGGDVFDRRGGVGFDRRKKPNPKCPECFGEGIGYTVVKDQRSVSPAAARLLAGVKETKEGIEVKMHDPVTALDRVARHLGMFVDRVDHTTNGQPLPPGAVNVILVRPVSRKDDAEADSS